MRDYWGVARSPADRTPRMMPAGGNDREYRPLSKERHMNKWNLMQNSKVVRVAASASTLVAVAAIVGAGYKWY